MPELDEVAYWCCSTVLGDELEIEGSTPGRIYVVRWEAAPPGHPYSMWWHCYGAKDTDAPCWPWAKNHECKHVVQAKREHCGWDTGPGIGDSGEPVEAQTEYGDELQCPRCGGPVTAQRWGV